MHFVSSNISFTNRVEKASLYFYNGYLFGNIPILKPIEQQIFSRCAGLFISPAALLEMAVHGLMLPFSVIYAIGKSIYIRQCDFILPWQHIQRIRDSVFPIFFGSLFGLIHPYLGTYAAEPTKKHIATGILLSGTDKRQFDSVCSPLTAMHEVSSLLSKLPDSLSLSKEERKLLKQATFWEGEFEKIQSIDFFNLDLTFKLGNKIQGKIEDLNLPPIIEGIVKRIALVTYPIFALLDLTVYVFTTMISLATLGVKIIGGQSPAYLEKASSPEVLIYNIVKIPLFIISSTIGFIVAIVNPDAGLACAKYPMKQLPKIPFLLKMQGLKLRLRMIKAGERILIPAVQTFSDLENLQSQDLSLLPTRNSHMRYLLIEKTDKTHFEAELIERGANHGKIMGLSRSEMGAIAQETLALRYKFGNEDTSILNRFDQKDDDTLDLGQQIGINNCPVTNLFAALEVVHTRLGKDNFDTICTETKFKAMRRYQMYATDFYPFGNTDEILEEIENLAAQRI